MVHDQISLCSSDMLVLPVLDELARVGGGQESRF